MSLPDDVASRIEVLADDLELALPRGPAWNWRPNSNWRKLLEGLVVPLAWFEALADRLLFESDPRTTTELLPEFERSYGLPDCTSAGGSSIVARRAALVARITPLGQTRAAIETAVGFYGIECEVEQHKVAVIDDAEIGDELTDEAWANALTVHLPVTPVVFFQADWSGAGDALVEDVSSALECLVDRIAPAHLVLVFQYDLPGGDYQPWEPFELTLQTADLAPQPIAPAIVEG